MKEFFRQPWGRKKTVSLIALFFLAAAGIAFRMWFVGQFPEPLIYDQWGYNSYATEILRRGIYAMSARTYGYPLFLAIIYRIFGPENDVAWKTVQAILDTSTAVVIFSLSRMVFRKTPAVKWIAMALYVFNPLTAAYAGVRMSEVLAIFLTISVFTIAVGSVEKRRSGLAFAEAFLAGYLIQVKPGMSAFSLAVTVAVLTGLFLRKATKRFIPTIVLSAALFFLPAVYAVAGNISLYRQFSLTTVDNLFAGGLYMSIMYPRGMWDPPSEPDADYLVTYMNGEYAVAPTNAAERSAMAKKYFDRDMVLIRANPQKFWVTRFMKILWMWDKRWLFYYRTTPPELMRAIYWTNRGVLAFALLGLFWWLPAVRNSVSGRMSFITGILLVGSTAASQMMATVEDRYTLILYPVIFIFAAYAISGIVSFGRKHPFRRS